MWCTNTRININKHVHTNCCRTRIWLRSCSASCRNCSSSLIVRLWCLQATLRSKYWSGWENTRACTHAHTHTRSLSLSHTQTHTHTHTRLTSWHLQDREAEILWVQHGDAEWRMGTSFRLTQVQNKGGCSRRWGWVEAWRVAWLFKHPQSGSKGHLSQALTFPDSISLLCCCIALFARPSPKSPQHVCVCACVRKCVE